MITIEVYENNFNIDVSRKGMVCPGCGHIMPCMYISPSICPKCYQKIPDALGMILGMDVFDEKLRYHKVEAPITNNSRPTYLTGNYDE